MHRVYLLKNQLSSTSSIFSSQTPEDPKHTLHKYRSKSTINPTLIQDIFLGNIASLNKRIFDIFASDQIFEHHLATECDRKGQRTLSFRQMKKFLELFGPITLDQCRKNPLFTQEIGSCVAKFDCSLNVRLMVQFILYAQTIMVLGTEKHQKLIEDALSMKDIGCFGLTELGHGTNANGILTTATYDPETNEFIMNSPKKIAMKMWIGGAGQTSNISVIFAQLYVNGVNQGIHAFIVPLRRKSDYTLLPGVIAGDCGAKSGWNGVDNGFIMFDNVRISYDNLLNRFCTIDKENGYRSSVKSAGKRFALTISALSGGRVFVISNSINVLVSSLTIAIRYAAVRKQFGPPAKAEISVLDYPLTQYRLLPYLAETVGVAAVAETIKGKWYSLQDVLFEEKNPVLVEFHALLSCLKPMCSWTAQQVTQECREVCGGLGYSAYNRLGDYRNDNDVILSGEGDNNVLLQQTGKFLLKCLRRVHSGEGVPYPSMYFLTKSLGECKYDSNIQKALEVRANILVYQLYAELQKTIEKAESPLDAWNEVQVYYCRDAAFAYGELYMLNGYWKRVEDCKDPATKVVLNKLYELYGYTRIERGASALLEGHYMTREDVRTVREKIVILCRELKDEAVGFIDAIAPPDHVLNCPIGAADGDAYNRFIHAVWTAPGAFGRPDYWREIVDSKKNIA